MTELKKVSWFTKVFEDYFIVEIIHGGKKKTFHMKEIKKITNNTLTGKDLNDHQVTYCTSDPFDYYVKKIY